LKGPGPHARLPPQAILVCPMSEEETFKVTDRRGRAEEAPAAGRHPAAGGPPGAQPRERGHEAKPASPGASGPSELGALFVMFANAALVSLGAVPEPGTGEGRLDLDQARSAIDVLVMLRDKTQGNRTDQESRLLEELVYDLQMRFVRAARGGSS
jgi:hypothetical protein